MRTAIFSLHFGLATLMFSSTASLAQDGCAQLGEIADSIMHSRQSGDALSEMIDLAKSFGGDLGKVLTQITIDAYEEPKWRTEENKQNAISEFRNKVELQCYKDPNMKFE